MNRIILNSTNEALEYGENATREQIEDLRQQHDTHTKLSKAMLKVKDFDGALKEAYRGQLVNEALSVAKSKGGGRNEI
jgi:hypothetical protein